MPRQDDPLAEALCTCRPDEIRPDDVEQRGAHITRPPGDVPDGEDERREHQVLELIEQRAVADRVASRRRQPPQLDREEQLQDEGEPEHGHRDAQERSRRGGEVEEAVLPHRAVDTERDRDHRREDERHRHQLDRRGEPLGDHLAHRTSGREADSEVAAQHRRQPADVLDRHRLIEAEALPERFDHLRVDEQAVLQEDGLGASRRGLDDQEDEQRNAEEERHHLDEAATDIAAHEPLRAEGPPELGRAIPPSKCATYRGTTRTRSRSCQGSFRSL